MEEGCKTSIPLPRRTAILDDTGDRPWRRSIVISSSHFEMNYWQAPHTMISISLSISIMDELLLWQSNPHMPKFCSLHGLPKWTPDIYTHQLTNDRKEPSIRSLETKNKTRPYMPYMRIIPLWSTTPRSPLGPVDGDPLAVRCPAQGMETT